MQVTIQGSVYAVVIQEVELVWVPIVEDRDVESESEMGEKPNEVSVTSPQVHVPRNQVRVASPCWRVNQLWDSGDGGVVGGHARSMDVLAGCPARGGLDRGRGGVCSAGDAAVATVGDRTKVSMDVAVVGVVGAALAPILGAVSGGICKVKSVNCLVEALASPEQRQVVAAARSRKGGGRPMKSRGLIEVGSDIVNASLTYSDIQEGTRFVAESSIVARHYVLMKGQWIPEDWECGMVSVYAPSFIEE
ncbi:hypothetical protein V6N12_074762 [Hibiscus sabdariffa]|uniref:Uncharacterized protein n=1 Tax=Hibiscus sabdariffa TaxID=183260 RepID=A0ABR2D2D0_9ROSI